MLTFTTCEASAPAAGSEASLMTAQLDLPCPLHQTCKGLSDVGIDPRHMLGLSSQNHPEATSTAEASQCFVCVCYNNRIVFPPAHVLQDGTALFTVLLLSFESIQYVQDMQRVSSASVLLASHTQVSAWTVSLSSH